MTRTLVAAAVAFAAMGTGAAVAADRCTVPMSEWQPREALQQKLQAAGWNVKKLKTENGCYEAYAIDDKGRRVEAYFDPKTFETVKVKVEG